ncbi:sensor domain-containing diguanylate cyclase [Vibrio agarivorans]|uniref:sensor domain-containing diguanylate cyclase n=1 Tax=Vibrio agarivorans TaxID=153622 RepID=UPI002231A91C|nr:sensor domain-containing diguanylate cyclase [Vibrio agarivorans]
MSACFNEKIYQTLLQSTQAIPWALDWNSKRFTFVSDHIEARFGWPNDSWQTVRDWISLIHPEDRQKTVETWLKKCELGINHQLEYRCRKVTGEYIWIQDTIHVIQENGKTTAIAGLMTDISETKSMESELIRIREQNRNLQRTDSLTGLANQACFDEHLSMEYSRAKRNKSALSLLMFELDDFSQYYNFHGPLMGDKVMLQVASLIEQNFSRPADKVALLNNNIFAVILPETEEMTAQLLAESVRQTLFEAKLTHKRSSVTDRVSISIGCAAFSPQTFFRTLSSFLEKATVNMHRARQMGGNRVFPRPTLFQFLGDEVTEGNVTKHDQSRRL